MPILEFFPALKAWIGSESRRRDPDNGNCIPFALVPDIGTKELTDGYALMQVAMAFIRIQYLLTENYSDKFKNTIAKTTRRISLFVSRECKEFGMNTKMYEALMSCSK